MTALQGFRIVELAERVAGEYCGKLLSDFGAEIIKVERPGTGSPTRSMAPFVGTEAGVENSGLFAYLNTNKKSVILDVDAPGDAERLHRLIASADAVIDDHDPDWLKRLGLDPEAIERAHPDIILCSITPYGSDAPREWWCCESLNVFHSSGWGYHTPGGSNQTRAPLKGPGRFLVDYDSGLDAAMGIVSSLCWRKYSGKGQVIDVSEKEVMMSRADTVISRMLAGEMEVGNDRGAYDQAGPAGFFPCADGFIYLYMTSRAHWVGLKKTMGNPVWAEEMDENWLEFAATRENVAKFRAGFGPWILTKDKDGISEEAQKSGCPIVPVNDASDLQRNPQYQFREFFQTLKHPVIGEAVYPTVPYKLSGTPVTLVTSAPRLGEHTAAILDSVKPAPKLKATPRPSGPGTPKTERSGPLAGYRILSLTKVWAGPFAGKLLAYLGAEVIKVESRSNLDEMRAYGGADIDHAPWFLTLNSEVLSVQLNLKTPAGIAELKDMVAKSDVVMDNIRPGAMERLGLDYAGMRAIKRDIIGVSIKMYGTNGPLGYQTGYAPCFVSLGGLNYLAGYEGEEPTGTNIRYGDSTVGANAAFAAMVALAHRERTGEGQFIDLSAVECMSSAAGDSLFAYGLTGKSPAPDGNFHADMAPHGCYPCRDSEWVSIAVASDAQWRKLCEVIDRSDLASDPRYASLAGRQANRAALDEALNNFCKSHEALELASRLRAAGVPAARSQNSADVLNDRSEWDREFYRFVSNHKEGQRPVIGSPWRMSQAAASITNGAPLLGEHNDYVYREVLGRSQAEFEALVQKGIVN